MILLLSCAVRLLQAVKNDKRYSWSWHTMKNYILHIRHLSAMESCNGYIVVTKIWTTMKHFGVKCRLSWKQNDDVSKVLNTKTLKTLKNPPPLWIRTYVEKLAMRPQLPFASHCRPWKAQLSEARLLLDCWPTKQPRHFRDKLLSDYLFVEIDR